MSTDRFLIPSPFEASQFRVRFDVSTNGQQGLRCNHDSRETIGCLLRIKLYFRFVSLRDKRCTVSKLNRS
jgi:hypothetical protein